MNASNVIGCFASLSFGNASAFMNTARKNQKVNKGAGVRP
jgi:hypothetical protein